jgi:hypothetical protein
MVKIMCEREEVSLLLVALVHLRLCAMSRICARE